jgi:hypothetical protein
VKKSEEDIYYEIIISETLEFVRLELRVWGANEGQHSENLVGQCTVNCTDKGPRPLIPVFPTTRRPAHRPDTLPLGRTEPPLSCSRQHRRPPAF